MAHLAVIWFISSVQVHMTYVVGSMNKLLVTEFTLVCLLACIVCHVVFIGVFSG